LERALENEKFQSRLGFGTFCHFNQCVVIEGRVATSSIRQRMHDQAQNKSTHREATERWRSVQERGEKSSEKNFNDNQNVN
jgi:hypothetical protein